MDTSTSVAMATDLKKKCSKTIYTYTKAEYRYECGWQELDGKRQTIRLLPNGEVRLGTHVVIPSYTNNGWLYLYSYHLTHWNEAWQRYEYIARVTGGTKYRVPREDWQRLRARASLDLLHRVDALADSMIEEGMKRA